jgi:hypothetical protein
MPSLKDAGRLESFAFAHKLTAGSGGDLPKTGSLLERSDLKLEGAANGALPGGRSGVIAHTVHTTRSNDTTTTHRHTAVITRVPESMGYAPYLLIGSGFGLSSAAARGKAVDAAPGVRVIADAGVDEGWLRELFSPAFAEWLQRSPDDFGAELADGVLVVIREGHLTDRAKLESLCEDAVRVAGEISEESIEEAATGGGSVAKGPPPSREQRLAAAIVPEIERATPPAHVESDLADAVRLAKRSPALIASTVRSTLLWMLGINIIGGGIYGLLLNLPNPLMAVAIYQVILVLIVAPLIYRSRTKNVGKRASEDAFYAEYAKARGLREVEPLRFAAEHAEANLPGKPVRVFAGAFGGVPGHLMLTGDGRERDQEIALVRGPRGPVAKTELNVSAPGVSVAALDGFVETLVLDLETAPTSPVAAAPGG